jgi:peptidoglycan hydrolase CwlO-like protein
MYRHLLLLVLITGAITLQAQVREETIEYNKEKQSCLAIHYKYPPEAVENAIREKMKKMGYRTKEEKGLFNPDKGFIVANNAIIKEISPNRYDYVVKVDKKGKEGDETDLYLLVMQNNVNMISELRKIGELASARSFLSDIVPDIELAHLDLKIKDQEEVVSKAEKKLDGLKGNKEDMEKKIKKLQEEIDKNLTDQESQQAEIENLKKILEELKAKKKN